MAPLLIETSLIRHEEKELIASRLRKWLNERPEISQPKLYAFLKIQKPTWYNFMADNTLLRIEKMIALEVLLEAKFGYVRDVSMSMPENYIPISVKPAKKGQYLVRGKDKEGKTRTVIGTYNGQTFYKCEGIKPEVYRTIPV